MGKITIELKPNNKTGKIDIDAVFGKENTIKDTLQAMQFTYHEYSKILQDYFGLDSHSELIDFLNDIPEACEILVGEIITEQGPVSK